MGGFQMGDAKRRQLSDAEFLKTQTECVYCGASPKTVEHFPPRAFFTNKVWPDGFRFASCATCNAATRHEEQVVSFLAGMKLEDGPWNEQSLRLAMGIKNNQPEVFNEWFDRISRNELKRRFRSAFGEAKGDEFRRRGLNMFHYGPLTMKCFEEFGRKLMAVLYYKHIGTRCDGPTFSKLQSTIDQREAMEGALKLAPNLVVTSRNARSLSDQFAYRYSFNLQAGVLFVVAQLGDQLGYIGHAFSANYWLHQEEPPEWRDILKEFYRLA